MPVSRVGWKLGSIEISLALALLLVPLSATSTTQDTLPKSLTNREFWSLTERLSEPNGVFFGDNLVSNEPHLSSVAASVAGRVRPSGVYLGVGPEQNFTYIAATRPRMAFVLDIRRANLQLHLLYKAVFEMTDNRVEFVAQLFSRRVPALIATSSRTLSADALMNAFLAQPAPAEGVYQANLKAVTDHLMRQRNLPLGAADLAGIDYAYQHFYRFGPAIHYLSSINGPSDPTTSYSQLQSTQDSVTGVEHAFLATEARFNFVKSLHDRNLIVPVVGDFAGTKSLRAVGAYLKERGAIVGAFYVSNVEGWLRGKGVWRAYCENVAALPLDASSLFIRPWPKAMNGEMQQETADCRSL